MYLQYWLFKLSPSPSLKLGNFEPVEARPKFCNKLSKSLKAKAKDNEFQLK
jgi:hypothetical protein